MKATGPFTAAEAPAARKRALQMAGMLVVAAGLIWAAPTAAQQAAEHLSPATVRMLQHSLIQGGYAVDAADGIWGPKTAAALREFQRVKGLEPTGRADAQTLAALGLTANGAAQPPGQRRQGIVNPPPVQSRTPADLGRTTIRAIQQALDRQGLKVGQVDGVWGERTTTAIANLQRARGMPASGELDAHTLAALNLLPGGERPIPDRAGQPPTAADLDPAAVRMIQQALGQRGFNIGTPDGIWGDRTVSALRDFQRTRGLEPLGEPDVYTLAALGLLPGSGEAPRSRRP